MSVWIYLDVCQTHSDGKISVQLLAFHPASQPGSFNTVSVSIVYTECKQQRDVCVVERNRGSSLMGLLQTEKGQPVNGGGVLVYCLCNLFLWCCLAICLPLLTG